MLKSSLDKKICAMSDFSLDFFRFPHTPHLAWLGEGSPRDDKVLLPNEVKALLANDVLVEEKLDGANVGLSLTPDGSLRAQNRGQYLEQPRVGQFARLPAWLAQHEEGLRSVLKPNLILFGEWCAARHSLDYAALPDWFLLFDVYDRSAGRFWSSSRRNALARSMGLVTAPRVLHEKTTVTALKQLVVTKQSHYREGPLEGVVIRRESPEWCEARAKLVRPDFTQAIDTHWRKRTIEWNRIVNSSGIPE
jgi:ATP-dependent RNA circularization protein (DNA/RNA ligase family)